MKARYLSAMGILFFLAAAGFALSFGTSQVKTTTTTIDGQTLTISEKKQKPGKTRTITLRSEGQTRTFTVPGKTKTVPGGPTRLVRIPGLVETRTVTRVVTKPSAVVTTESVRTVMTPVRTVTQVRTVSAPGATTTRTVTQTTIVRQVETVTHTQTVPAPAVTVAGPTTTVTQAVTVTVKGGPPSCVPPPHCP
jgi:hypothetical protein